MIDHHITKRVFDALAVEHATVSELCQATGLFAADVMGALIELAERGWIEIHCTISSGRQAMRRGLLENEARKIYESAPPDPEFGAEEWQCRKSNL